MKVQEVYFGVEREQRVKEVEDVLNIFDDRYCNQHLMYGIVDLILVRLIPEMGEKGVEELLADRLG